MAAEDARFDLSTEDILLLKEAGASDTLIRAMIGREDREGDWTDPYYSGPVVTHVRLYYDPFGYHWYGYPFSFSYYYPFSWWDCGFYYAGWYHRAWWFGGHRTRYYWNHYHWAHWDGRHDRDRGGRHAWNREPAGRDSRSAWTRDSGRSSRIQASRSAVDRTRDGSRSSIRSPRRPSLDGQGSGSVRSGSRHAYGRETPRRDPRPSVSPAPPSRSDRGSPNLNAPRSRGSAPASRPPAASGRSSRGGERSGWRR